jgi:hypothetical protein
MQFSVRESPGRYDDLDYENDNGEKSILLLTR